MRIDSMALACEAFMCCRHLHPAADALLEALQPVMDAVRREGTLLVEAPVSLAQLLAGDFRDRLACGPEADASLSESPSEERQRLLRAIETGAVELRRLRQCNADGAVRSLGYALHRLPELVSSGEICEPKLFAFSLQVAARWWFALSIHMQERLCELAGVGRDRVASLLDKEGFVIDMFP